MDEILKQKIANDVFSTEAECKARSYDMGLGGEVHVVQDSYGQAYYMPGKSVEEYMAYYHSGTEQMAPENSANTMGLEDKDAMCRAIETIMRTIMNKSAIIEGKILKVDEEQRIIYGWASVATEKGEPVIDLQGDVIAMSTLEKAVNEFMEHVRVGKTMHVGEQTGVVIHSLPVSKEIAGALGIQADREGWVVGYKVYDESVWQMVKSGELRAFSIGGRAIKEEYNA